jgi:hypothetical protein
MSVGGHVIGVRVVNDVLVVVTICVAVRSVGVDIGSVGKGIINHN